MTQSSPDPATSTVLLIGTSRGLSLGMAGEFAKRGWRTVATVRDGLMTQNTRLMFMNLYISSLDELRGQKVSLQIDHHEFMQFDAPQAKSGGLIIGVHAEASDEAVHRELKDAARDAHQFEVVAGDFRAQIPVEGLRQAVDD